MSGLSSRVMNMKFMMKADERKKKEEEESNDRKVADDSEWALNDHDKIINKVEPKNVIKNVGYGSIHAFKEESDDDDDDDFTQQPVTTKRSWNNTVDSSMDLDETKIEKKGKEKGKKKDTEKGNETNSNQTKQSFEDENGSETSDIQQSDSIPHTQDSRPLEPIANPTDFLNTVFKKRKADEPAEPSKKSKAKKSKTNNQKQKQKQKKNT